MALSPTSALKVLRPDSPKSFAKSYHPPKIAIVIPVYNEAANIEKVLAEVKAIHSARPRWKFLTFVVNDGSTDETSEILERLSYTLPMEFHVIPLPLNLGIGKAIQTGFQVALRWGADVCLQLDGDGQHPPSQVPRLVCPILTGQAQVVVGSRYVQGGGGNVSTRTREWGTWFFSMLLKLLVGVRIQDTTSGFRAWDRGSMKFILKRMVDDYPEVDAYVSLVRQSFKIAEVPVDMRPRQGGSSSIGGLQSFYYGVKVTVGTLFQFLRSGNE